jgi:hypothetical protein
LGRQTGEQLQPTHSTTNGACIIANLRGINVAWKSSESLRQNASNTAARTDANTLSERKEMVRLCSSTGKVHFGKNETADVTLSAAECACRCKGCQFKNAACGGEQQRPVVKLIKIDDMKQK